MNAFFYGGVLITSFIALWLASDKAVEYAMRIAKFLGISSLLIGFIVLSIATGLPELSIAFQSIVAGVPELSVGNILGANFSVISLCLGVVALFWGPLYTDLENGKRQPILLLLSALLVAFVFTVESLQRSFGIFLIAIFLAGIWWLIKREESIAESFDGYGSIASKREFYGVGIKLTIALAAVLFFSKIAVESSLVLIEKINFASEIVGLLVMSIGSTLPELSLNIQAMRKKNYALVLGNTLGSIFEQGSLILGVLALGLSRPLSLDNVRYIAPFMFFSYGVVAYGLFVDKRIGKVKGLLLVAAYLLFVTYTMHIHIGWLWLFAS